MSKAPEFYEAGAVYNKTEIGKYKKLLNAYESTLTFLSTISTNNVEWYNGQRVMLLDYYLSQQKPVVFQNLQKKTFSLNKLPPTIIRSIASEFF